MKLRVFLPAIERPEPRTAFAWMLLDARGTVLREDRSAASGMPKAEETEIVLPAARVLFARLRLPRVNAATIRELLPFAVEDRLLADPAHIHAVAGRANARGETLVAVVDRDWLAAMASAFDREGRTPKRAYCESALLAADGGAWHLVWGPARGMLVDDEGAAATFDRDGSGALPLALRIALDEASARGARPKAIEVHAEANEKLPDLARWGAEAGIAFSAGSAWEKLAAGEPGGAAIDLLQGEFAPGSRWSLARIPRAAVVLAAAIVVLQVALSAAQTWRLASERERLEAEREAIFRGAFPEAKTVVDPELQMTRNLAQLQRTRGLAADDDFLAALTRAGRGATTAAKAIEYDRGRLRVVRDGATVAEAR